MTVREQVDQHLAANNGGPEGIHAALRTLADAVDELRRPKEHAERLNRLAEEGFEQGVKGQ